MLVMTTAELEELLAKALDRGAQRQHGGVVGEGEPAV